MQEDNNRIYETVRHIEQNLDKTLVLEDLATIACFSPFHFQRVFKEVIGETPKQFVKRLRLEEAAHRIVLHPEKSILEAALSVGFQSLESFSRAFKDYYSISPDHFKKRDEAGKLEITSRVNRNRVFIKESSILLASSVQESDFENIQAEIVKRPEQQFVYLQTTLESAQLISESFKKLRNWTTSREIAKPDAEMFGLIKDYPLFTALDKCRYLACISVDHDPQISGIYQFSRLPSRKYVAFRVKGGMQQIFKVASYLAHHWLPDKGYRILSEPAIQFPMENPINVPFDENTHQVYLRIQPI